MPRSLALLSLLATLGLAACDEMPMPTEPDGGIGDGGGQPMPVEPDGGIGDGAGDTCGVAGLREFIGQDESVVAATLFTNPIRIVRPGDMVTMDFNPQRINFRVGEDGLIDEITCG